MFAPGEAFIVPLERQGIPKATSLFAICFYSLTKTFTFVSGLIGPSQGRLHSPPPLTVTPRLFRGLREEWGGWNPRGSASLPVLPAVHSRFEGKESFVHFPIFLPLRSYRVSLLGVTVTRKIAEEKLSPIGVLQETPRVQWGKQFCAERATSRYGLDRSR